MILVTGGAGYVGSVLVPKLVEEEGADVRVLDKMVFGAQGLDAVKDDIEIVAGDIRHPPEGILDGVTAVVHLAGLSNDPTAEYNPAANASINTDGTISLATACKAAGVERFIFASSCSVYYTMEPDDTLRDEEYAINPTAPYSHSKYEAEKGLLELADDTFHPVILRKGTVFGLSPRKRYDLVVNAFTKDAYQRGCLTIHAGGRMWRPMLHIEDAADAYIACLKADLDRVSGQAFNVLSGNHTVLEIAQEVKRALEVAADIQVDMDIQAVGAVRSYRVSGDKYNEHVGYCCDMLRRDISTAAIDM